MGKIKIAFLGLGGVGGFYGGKLAKFYSNSEQIEISFIARNENFKKIKNDGLRVITDGDDFVAHPYIVTDNPETIGVVDFLILAMKSYDLETSLLKVKGLVGERTVVLPLLNGGDITEQIRSILPGATVWSGCSYIVSRRIEPGVIRSTGGFHKIFFGYDGKADKRLKELEKIFQNADVDADYSEGIRSRIWQKFFFISVSASMTSFFDVGFNELAETEERKEMTRRLTREFLSVAEAEGVDVGYDESYVINRAAKLPAGSTTSMHSDFIVGGATEVETLTGAVIRFARDNGIEVPGYEEVYQGLIQRLES